MKVQPHKHILPAAALLLSMAAWPGTAAAQSAPAQDSLQRLAYGSQPKDQVTVSAASVSGAELRKTHTTSLSNTLIGRLPGLAIMNNGGEPGFDDPDVFIRGRHTTGNNGQLVLVDGIQINSLSYLSVDEIESVTVLKDAAALALFGAKAANGALLVTTRRGSKSKKVNIGFNARYGFQAPTVMPKLAGSYDYARLHNEARQNDGLAPLYSQQDLDGYRAGTDPYLYPNVNWYDEVLRKSSPLHDYSLTFDGGGETARYFVMLGYMNNQGLYAGTDGKNNANIQFQRINFRANVDLNITKSLTVQAGLGGNLQDRKFPPIGTADMWRNMVTYAPNLYPVRTPDGKITGSANYPNNPVGYLLEKGYQSRHDRNIQSTVRVTQKLDVITPGLEIFGAMMFDNEFNGRYDKLRNYAYYEPIRTTGPDGLPQVNFMERGLNTDLTVTTGNDYENNRIIFNGGLNYNRRFNQHGLAAMVMFQRDKYTVLNNQSAFAMENLAGRISYDYQQKYLAEFSFSYSGLENYPPGRRFGFFPALSAGWLLHKEDFLKNSRAISYLKLRASAGLVGNDRGASRFAYNQYWGEQSSQGYYFGTGTSFSPAFVQLGMANPNITWEKGLIYNFGADAAFLQNKLSLTLDVFRENRYDILVNMGNVIPGLAGIPTAAMENRGKVLNYGTEVAATWKDKAGSVNYFVGGQFSFARNKVTEAYDVPRKEAYASRQNQPVAQYFGLEALGFFKNESDIASSPTQTFSNVRPGDIKYKDQNGDGIIDINDEVPLGRHSYPEINFSFNAGVEYKGFNLELFFQGMANRTIYMEGYLFQPFANGANITDWYMENRWTPERHAVATAPRLTTEPNPNNYRASDFWFRSGSFLRLRNVELGYTFPKHMLRKLHMQNLRIFVSGLNLLSWDNLDANIDPETLSIGYPVLKTYTTGLSVNF